MELRTPFWQHVARSLPAPVLRRYGAELERAERMDILVAVLIDTWRSARSALARRIDAPT